MYVYIGGVINVPLNYISSSSPVRLLCGTQKECIRFICMSVIKNSSGWCLCAPAVMNNIIPFMNYKQKRLKTFALSWTLTNISNYCCHPVCYKTVQ